jgi:hypothetical protein
MKKQKLILAIIISITFFLIIASVLYEQKNQAQPSVPTETNIINDENLMLKNSEIIQEIYGFSAVIKNINNRTLTLEGTIPTTDGSITQGMAKAIITDQTEIAKLKFPNTTENKSEQILPQKINIKLNELKVGDNVNIVSIKNIYDSLKNNTSFLLDKIFIIEK